jgi:hypothetical protein
MAKKRGPWVSRYPEFKPCRPGSPAVESGACLVNVSQFAGKPRPGATFAEFMASLPRIYAGSDVRAVAARMVSARKTGRAVVVSCGAHVIKCGLSPVLVTLMEQGFITALALNGAGAIHDVEIALTGATSENVEQGLQQGTFGMAAEPSTFINRALDRAQAEGLGAGEALGRSLVQVDAPFCAKSMLASAYRLEIPLTVHIAIGTDIIHMHSGATGAAHGDASMRDFRILTEAMRSLSDGGVLLNFGSAVLLPEVILKAIALLRHESQGFAGLLGVDCDFIRQHRATQQLVERMRAIGGEGIALTGHHEIMIPLLAFAVLDEAQQAR